MEGSDIKTDGHGNSIIVNGDFVLDHNQNAAYVNRLLLVAKGGFVLHPDFGIGLHTFVGKNNNAATHDEIRQTILSELRKYGINAECDVMGTDEMDGAVIMIYDKVSYSNGVKNFEFNFDSGRIQYIEEKINSDREDAGQKKTDNKYFKRRNR